MAPASHNRTPLHFDVFLSPPELGGNEAAALTAALASNWVAPAGPMLRKFERLVAEKCGVEHAVAVSSGTAALHLALRAAGVGAGDEVLCATFSFVASANPVLYLGATPVFIDSEERTWNIDPGLVEEALRDRAARGRVPKAMIVTDIYGQCVDADPLRALADKYGVVIVEDAAEAFGAFYRGRAAGSLGDIAALSFNGNKIITTSGGGMVISNRSEWVDRAHFWATQAREPGAAYTHRELGYNYRLSNVLAALGCAQMEHLSQRVAARQALFERYVAGLGGLPGVRFMPEPEGFTSTRWLTCLTLDDPVSEDASVAICEKLHKAGIEARPLWRPLHEQPVYNGAPCYGGAVSQRLAERGLSLPSGSSLSPADQDRVIEVFRSHF